ncbi:uncharacterized protein [Eucyclogobius newberryi]|uniref:uncharacterized protein n=1 Tax=Eucyclogobius newberryi TaxID=166745 RepID=UPI003B5A8BDB
MRSDSSTPRRTGALQAKVNHSGMSSLSSLSSPPPDPRLVCSLCLRLLSDPVTVPCGHNFCRSCLSSLWGRGADAGGRGGRCPRCGATFSPTQALTTDAALLELLRGVKSVSLTPSAPPLDGFQHATFDLSAFQPEGEHGERLLGKTHKTLAQQISQKESERHILHNAMKDYHRAVKAALKDCSGIFSELQEVVERGRVQMKHIIRAQEQAEMTRAENHLKQLEQELVELRSREPRAAAGEGDV